MDLSAISGDVNRPNLAIALPIGVNLTIFLQPAEPGPLQAAQPFQILQASIPAIESHQFRRESTLLSLTQNLPEVVFFAQAIFFLVVQAEIARQTRLAIRPQQGEQVDPFDDRLMFARPMMGDQIHLLCVWFIQGAIIQDQHLFLQRNQRFHLLPKRRAIRLGPVQQARVGIMRWTLFPIGMGFGRFRSREGILAGNQEVNIVEVITFWWIHVFSVTELNLRSTA